MRRTWAGLIVAGVLAMAGLLAACSSQRLDILSTTTYAKIEKAGKKELVLQLGEWQDEAFVPGTWQAKVAPEEIAEITTGNGTAMLYQELETGDIVQIFVKANTNEEESELRIQVVKQA
ncbi:hypothetical protein LJC61_08980 [Ruminococcaceae bacterium OttesenSCG-928-A16]|nr:hypothetical protein [Ruminococcaceae bacterium OttesenSCG-928-A16]